MKRVTLFLVGVALFTFSIYKISLQKRTFSILRPLNYEVYNLHLQSIPIEIGKGDAENFEIEITEQKSGAKIFSWGGDYEALSDGKLNIPIENLRGAKGPWLSLLLKAPGFPPVQRFFGIGYIFLTAGQSNAGNHECEKCQDSNSYFSNDVSFLQDPGYNPNTHLPGSFELKNLRFIPQTIFSPLATGYGANVWNPLGKMIAEKTGRPVAFIGVAKGTTSVLDWINPEKLRKAFNYGKGFPLNAVLWHQGESDQGILSKVEYEKALKNLIDYSRNLYGYRVPWVIAKASFCKGSPPGHEIHDAQAEILSPQLQILSGPDTDKISHPCHFDTPEQLRAYAQSWFEAVEASGLL